MVHIWSIAYDVDIFTTNIFDLIRDTVHFQHNRLYGYNPKPFHIFNPFLLPVSKNLPNVYYKRFVLEKPNYTCLA